MRRKFKNADEAYNYFLDKIIIDGITFGDTKALFNVGFTLENPLETIRNTPNLKNKDSRLTNN